MAGRMSAEEVLSSIKGTKDSMSVRRAFGDPYELEGVSVIPVARIAGGAGGGGGEGVDEEGASGGGFGTGFGMGVVPIGVYEVRGERVEWKPTVDVNRVIKGAQVLAGIMVVCIALVIRARSN
jgi:uncharacterized spore protein YtfJ